MSSESTRVHDPAGRQFPSIEAFESGTLNPDTFDHAAHVFIAWKLLEENTLAQATGRFLAALKRLTRALNIESKYHETISCFYMTLIAERRAGLAGSDWQAFSDANPDLLGPATALLGEYYSRERLWSDLAKRQFLLPERNLKTINE
ncbi:hypothetical protein ACFL0N_02785 [Pseudomonadota bacterium]